MKSVAVKQAEAKDRNERWKGLSTADKKASLEARSLTHTKQYKKLLLLSVEESQVDLTEENTP